MFFCFIFVFLIPLVTSKYVFLFNLLSFTHGLKANGPSRLAMTVWTVPHVPSKYFKLGNTVSVTPDCTSIAELEQHD